MAQVSYWLIATVVTPSLTGRKLILQVTRAMNHRPAFFLYPLNSKGWDVATFMRAVQAVELKCNKWNKKIDPDSKFLNEESMFAHLVSCVCVCVCVIRCLCMFVCSCCTWRGRPTGCSSVSWLSALTPTVTTIRASAAKNQTPLIGECSDQTTQSCVAYCPEEDWATVTDNANKR